MNTYIIVTRPVGVNCSAKARRVQDSLPAAQGGSDTCPGVMFRLNLSRIEEGLGQEGFMCDKCGRRVKYIPKPA